MALSVAMLGMLLAAEAPAPILTAPVPLVATDVAAPAHAAPLGAALTVQANILVDESGAVTRVELLAKAGLWGEAVLTAATGFVFSPAMQDGVPVAAGITFSQEFKPGAPPQAQPTGALRLMLVEKGTRAPVVGAEIHVMVGGLDVPAQSDATGAASLRLPAGVPARVRVSAAGYKDFTVEETVQNNEVLKVRYLITRTNYFGYETIVVGKRDRTEVNRISLRGPEIAQVPGTFGDPFRVVTTMPGVSTLFSLLGYPIVRGTSPGSTAFMLDAVPVPELFHLLAGPSVIHPEFIDRVDFYPGTFPAEYGGYIGGIVDGITRRATPDERRVDVDADLLQSGLFLRGPLPLGFSGTAAARYGYPGLLLKAFQAPVGLSYWDYQGRLDGMLGDGRLKVFVFGSRDELTTVTNGVSSLDYGAQFHRFDASWVRDGTVFSQSYSVVLGVDETVTAGTASDLRSIIATPRARWKVKLHDAFALRLGVDLGLTTYAGGGALASGDTQTYMQNASVFLEAPWWVTSDFLITPGARVDGYTDGTTKQLGVDPRLMARLRLATREDGEVWLKGGGGRYHQPPRLVVPLPGYEQLALQQGLSSSWQASLGVEGPVLPGLDVDVQAYFNYLDRVVFDLGINFDPANPPQINETAVGNNTLPIFLGTILTPQSGRAFGVEMIARHKNSGNFFGWISYTLSRSERWHSNHWALFDFDRTHVLQLVGGWRLPRDWQIGGRAQFESGRPISSATAYNVDRSPPFYRVDIRVDKKAVYNTWIFDFYVDIINVTLAEEYLSETAQSIPYILPTLGVRGEF